MAQPKHEHAALMCTLCHRIVGQLFSSPWTVTLPSRQTVHEGDLICEECQRDLNKRFSDEQTFTRPVE